MAGTEQGVRILERHREVAAFLPDVVAAADSDKNALGFFPAPVIAEFARKEQLLVAVTAMSSGATYAGHLLYDARLPRATVLQMFVANSFRQRGIATAMLQRLKEHLTERTFASVYASVAEDLIQANAFWQQQGFYVQRIRSGGRTRRRTILVRCHELESPQLFAKSGISAANPLGLNVDLEVQKSIYLLDLNVLFDLGPRRERNEATLDLFRAERHGACQLALSTELRDELVRTAKAAPRSDPMHAWASIFIAFPVPIDSEQKQLLKELGEIVFPAALDDNTLTDNDRSDLKHLATAVHHRLAGFITSDETILNAATALNARFGIRVISPLAFQEAQEALPADESFETRTLATLALSSMTSDREDALRKFLVGLGVPDSDALTTWGAVDSNRRACERWAVWSGDALVGYLACPAYISGSPIAGRVAVDESSALASGAALLLLSKLIAHAGRGAPTTVRLEVPHRQASVREIAALLGFTRSDDGRVLSKLVLNRVIISDNWSAVRAELLAACGIRLPDRPPTIKHVDQQIDLIRTDGNRVFMPISTLESQLSPALFCLPGRKAVITPIQRAFAERLLDHSEQGSLLPRARAILFAERHYVSAERTLKNFARGTVILFYESGRDHGASAVVAVARVRRAYLKPSDAIDHVDLDPSVLDADSLSRIGGSKSKTVTAFDNVVILPNKVPLATLRRLGCGAPNQLISTRPIDSEQLQEILLEGFRHG